MLGVVMAMNKYTSEVIIEPIQEEIASAPKKFIYGDISND